MSSSATAIRKGVRKRVMMGSPVAFPHMSSPGLITASGSLMGGLTTGFSSPSGKARYMKPLEKIRNMLRTVVIMSFPLGIFLLPYFLSSEHNSSDYPPVIVMLSTTLERLPFVKPTLDAILTEQSKPPTRVYLILINPAEKDILGFQEERDELESLEVSSTSSSAWPSYLQDLVAMTPLQVLRPKIGYGLLSKIVNVVQQEEKYRESEEGAPPAFGDVAPRLIYIDDDVIPTHNWLKALVEVSMKHPQYALGFTGGSLRSNFRQIRFAKESTVRDYDKFPNIALQTLDKLKPPLVVDILLAMTGLCLPLTLLNSTRILPLLQQTLQQGEFWPDLASGDVVLSAVMETQNVTRLLLPYPADYAEEMESLQFANYSSNGLSAKGQAQDYLHDMAMEWIQIVSFLQTKWKIWRNYDFLDLKSLTSKQKQAMACEGLHEPDCKSRVDICLPNNSECSKFQWVLEEMNARDFEREMETGLDEKEEDDEDLV
jgi:hypothetical protein